MTATATASCAISKGPQDEINHRRSKGLHILNSRRLILEKGSVNDVENRATRMGAAGWRARDQSRQEGHHRSAAS